MLNPLRSIFTLAIIAFVLTATSCSNGQSGTSLSAVEFSKKLGSAENPIVVDVRTPREFQKGHLANALNIDISNRDFQSKMNELDKSKPAFVYCLSGSRSQSAVDWMQKNGFKEVYEMNGGLLRWRQAGLPEDFNPSATSNGMTMDQFNKLLATDKLVLIDFYAEWCAPCKKMEPYLAEISKDMKDKVQVVRIDIDKNQKLSEDLNIYALPTLQLYQNKTLAWSNVGYIGKDAVLMQLNKN